MSLRRGSLARDHRSKPPGTVGEVRRLPISKASDAQRDSVAGKPCVHCGKGEVDGVKIDPMHLAARGFRGGGDDPLDCVPGCRFCHRDFDDGKLDLSRDVSGPAYKEHLARMLLHYEGDWVAMGERLTSGKVLIEGAGGE